MRELLIFPDATALYTTYLREQLVAEGYTDVHVGTVIPNPRPETFIRVSRVGGNRYSVVIDESSLAIEVWAPTEAAAQDMAGLCRSLIFSSEGTQIDGHPIYRVVDASGLGSNAGLIYSPDRDTDLPRYNFTMVVATRGAAA